MKKTLAATFLLVALSSVAWAANNLVPTMQFTAATATVYEGAGSVSIDVSRNGPSVNTLTSTVHYATADGSALGGTDYTPVADTLTFSPGVKKQTITIPILDDGDLGTNETFTITLDTPTNGNLGNQTTITVTIVENQIKFDAPTYSVGEPDGSVVLTVDRIGDAGSDISVNYATADGTATAGLDYTATSGTLTIPAGQTSGTITVPIIDDTLSEGNETFTVTLSTPIVGSGVLVAPTTATVTIIDDEPPPTPTPSPTPTATATPTATPTPSATPSPTATVSPTPTPSVAPNDKIGFNPATYTVAESAGQLVVTVNRSAPGANPGAASVHYTTADGTALAGTDYTAASGDLNWPAGDKSSKTITIPILDDGTADAGEAFTIQLSDPVGTNIQQATATVNIVENVVQFSSSTYATAQSIGTATLTVTRTGETDAPVTVSYATSDGSADPTQIPAVNGTDYTGTTTGALTFDVGETSKQITVPVIDHPASYDPVRVFTVTLTAPTGSAVLGTTSAVVSIGESVLQFDQDSYTVAEDAGNVLLKVTRAGDVSQAVTVHYATADGSAVSGTNYTKPSDLTLNFDVGVASQQITIAILDDGVYTGDLNFRVGLSSPTNSATLTAPSVATVTIQDAQPAPTPTPTPTATPTPTPTSTETPSPTTTPSATETPTATPSASESPSPGATPTPTVSPGTFPAQPLNISTRGAVGTGENVMIGGFIIRGSAAKPVIVRALGPSLGDAGVAGALLDPILELHDASGTIATNDNWKDSQQVEIEATGVAPTNEAESAIVMTLQPGNYTAVVKGKNGLTGVALVEVYDLDPASDSELVNISTRGVVAPEPAVLIGGFIVGGAIGDTSTILVRALGPSLGEAGVANPLPDPLLAIHGENGDTIISDDNWADNSSQAAQIAATGIPPSNSLEAAAIRPFAPGKYTAVVSGKNGATGVALVEIYHIN